MLEKDKNKLQRRQKDIGNSHELYRDRRRRETNQHDRTGKTAAAQKGGECRHYKRQEREMLMNDEEKFSSRWVDYFEELPSVLMRER